MKRLISTLIALSMLVAMSAPAFTTYGQNPNSGQQPDPANDPLGPGHAIMHKLPHSGRIGSTPERKAALNNLSPEDKEKVKQIFRDMVAKAKQNDDLKKHQDDDLPTSLTVSFKDKDGNRQLRTAKRQKKGESTLTSALKVKGHNRYITLASTTAPSNGMILKSSYTRTVAGVKRAHALKKASAPQATSDGDHDGLPDEFENQVADTFTPHYHISAGEADQFATFNDSPVAPETINQLFGQTPVSHFRVHKEGFGTDASGATVSVLRIDYLTIWNQDDGLVGGAACAWSWLGLDDVVQALSGHYLDHERSAMLIAAPVSDGDYNLDPGSYSIYNIYTAGHEFTVGDTSMYWNFFYSPVPAYNHIELMLSQSKHAT